jgi:hypothetical protein
MLMQDVTGLLFSHQNIRYVALNHKMLYMPFSVYQVASSPPELVSLTLSKSCRHSRCSQGEPSASACC